MEDKQLHLLQVQYNGITLNNQDIDLMLIAGANNIYELKVALSKITNIKYPIEEMNLTESEFIVLRQRVYDLYLETLTSRPEYIMNKGIELKRKVDYLKASGILSNEEINIVNEILSQSKSKEEIVQRLNERLPDRVNDIYMTLKDFSPIEKTGVKSTTLEATRNLLEEIKLNYNSITIDEEAKYGKIVLLDGTFDFRHLQKALDFAKEHKKQVRLNTILFYMDCPEDLYNLEKTEDNKKLVKQKLTSYVDATTRFIRDNGYTSTVRSIDVFNELLNRFAMNTNPPYMYRGDIEQEKIQLPNGNFEVNDNIKSGWLKHLDIADLCEVIAVARQNLPEMDFMYNDDNIIDPNKIDATMELLSQIRAQEERLGVKLIDSIGTQMHIDNGMTKEQMKDMIISLSKFGLPIEVTEFDIVMTHGINGLSEEQINLMRQKKINEICECVQELKKDYNIRGFTIWSKTDKQNFRVNLANEDRIPKGLAPIETMYGGYYTEEMRPKGKTLTKNNFQSFNYHTHTYRCGHAGASTDREYVENARKNGITQLGFTDHVPVSELEFQDDEQQMDISEVDNYLESIHMLQSEYPDMTILSGFEVEYNPMKEQFLGELRERVDYMILGQHFVLDGIDQVSKNNPNYPLEYANIVCQAMESGLFDIVAHPDIFMKFRDSIKTEEGKKIFLENAKEASRQICQKAKEMGIPLELNFGGIIIGKKLSDGEYAYPHSLFWEIAAEEKVPTLYGVDAHNANQFDLMGNCKEKVDVIINPERLNIVSRDYNPVEARKRNPKLNEAYARHQASALSYETHLISYITNSVMSRIPDESFEPRIFTGMSTYMFDEVLKSSQEKTNKKKSELIKKGQEAVQKGDNTKQERAAVAFVSTERTISNQKQAIQRAKETITEATELGCTTKTEYKKAIKALTEQKSKTSQKENKEVNKKAEQKGPILVKKKPTNTNNGYISTLNLILLITSIFAISYILLNLK